MRLSAGWPIVATTSLAVDWPGTRLWPSKLAQPASASSKPRKRLLAFARLRTEVLLELVRLILVRIGVRRRRALAGDIRPLHGKFGVHLEPLFGLAVRVGNDRLGRALGLAYAAVDAFVGM